LAAVLYQPWRAAPFEPLDAGDTIPVFRASAGFLDGFSQLTSTYATHDARFFPTATAFLTAQWTVFGPNTHGWQAVNFVMMSAALALTFCLLTRLGGSLPQALAGSSVMVVGHAAIGFWTCLNCVEIPGLVLFLLAAFLAAGFQQARRWRLRAVQIGVLLAMAIWSKETMVAGVPFVILLTAAFHGREDWRLLPLSRKTIRGALIIAAITFAATLPILYVKAVLPPAGYGSGYSIRNVTAQSLRRVLVGIWLPFSDNPVHPANVVFVLLIVCGWWIAIARATRKSSVAVALVVALSLPLIGSLAYLPWFWWRADYGATYAVGIAILTTMSLNAIAAYRSPAVFRIAFGAYLIPFLLGSREAWTVARTQFVARDLFGAAAVVLAENSAATQTRPVILAHDDSLVVARVGIYAEVIAPVRTSVQATHYSCRQAQSRLGRALGDTLMVVLPFSCPRFSSSSSNHVENVTETWRRFSLAEGLVTDSGSIALWGGSALDLPMVPTHFEGYPFSSSRRGARPL